MESHDEALLCLLFRIRNQQIEASQVQVNSPTCSRCYGDSHCFRAAENVLTRSAQQIQRGEKVTVTVLPYFFFFFTSLNRLLFLKSCFLSSKMQLMTEQQISHSSIWTSSSKLAQHFWTCYWWKKMECQTGHLWKGFLNHVTSFLKSFLKNKPQGDSIPLFKQRVLRGPLSFPLKCWF